MTVRVPTHEGGSCLYWEFATDSYDIGFGVYFEWGKSSTNEVQVQVCDSEDEDEIDGGGEDDEDDGKYILAIYARFITICYLPLSTNISFCAIKTLYINLHTFKCS